MLERSDIKSCIEKLIVNYQSDLKEEKIVDMITLWHEKLKYWKLGDLQKVISYLIKNRDYMPRISHLFSTYKLLELGGKSREIKISYHCDICKGTGVRAYIEDNIIHAGACGCSDGQAIKKNNQTIPWIENILVAEGIKEYPIHKPNEPFGGYLPEGVGYRLAKEVAGKNSLMYDLTEQIEAGKIKISDAVSQIPEELPF